MLLATISIPHGTIKRKMMITSGCKQKIFQYLMVQLKGNGCCFCRRIFISIPHGTIKRSSFSSYLTAMNTFQYLMVQLKEHLLYEESLCPQTFQYLMVQLKVLVHLELLHQVLHFNTSWYN